MAFPQKLQNDSALVAGDNLPVALDLAGRGLAVFPITLKQHGKWTPEKGWQANATDDAATMKGWWRKWSKARVGLLCGVLNGIGVLDVDEKNGASGTATLAALGFPDVAALSPVRVRTPSGGWHLFFRYDPRLRNSVGLLGPGLDVRTEGGFVVAPGSYKGAGQRYEPQGDALGTVELPPWPEALIPAPKPEYEPVAIVTDATEEQRKWAAGYLDKLAARLGKTAEGRRQSELNNGVLWAGGAAAHGFLTRPQAEIALLPAAKLAGLPDREARSTFKGTWPKGLARPITTFPREVRDDDFDDFEDLGSPEVKAHRPAANDDQPTLEEMCGIDPLPIAITNPAPAADDSDEEIPTADHNPGGDYGKTRRFVAQVRQHMRFNRAEQMFMHYLESAGAWRYCNRGEPEQAMLACAVADYDDACAAFRSDPTDGYKKHMQAEAASYLKNNTLLTRALQAAKSHKRLVCLPTDFNADPYGFPVSNGLIDLRNGKLTPPSPELMISKLSPITFDPAASCPMFDDFMVRVIPDAEVRRFLQLAVGYTLTGLVDEEKIFLCYGVGRNGKSVLANIIEALLGEFSVTVSPELFTKSGSSSEGERQITSLIGRRLCLANEAAQASVWRDDRLKMLASRETIQGRFLYKETVTFFPTHKIWFRSNHLPGSHDGSDGFWRRLVAIPFSVQIPEAEVIGDLDRQIIRTELSGVLNWALAGAKAYLAAGRLIVPSVLTRVTAQYRDGCDILGQWLEMNVTQAPGERLPSGAAYQAYRDFCRDEGVTAPSKIAFSRSMGERGHPANRVTNLRFFNNLKLRCGFDDDDIG